jgi:hypothetical protein
LYKAKYKTKVAMESCHELKHKEKIDLMQAW